jgi:glycerol-3-phosphate dehydrogenase
MLALSQGAHIVLDKSFFPGTSALIIPRTADGRVLFAIPWHERTLIGTTDTPVSTPAAEPRPLASEIEFLLAHTARYLECKAGPRDILSTFAGLRPLVRSGKRRNTAKLSRSHCVEVSASGLVTITGGKWTTCRRMAEDTVNEAARRAGLPERPSRTVDLPLHGWTKVIDGGAPFAAYGADAPDLAALCDAMAGGHDRLHPRLPYCRGHVRWAVRHEMACTLEDVWSRRLRALVLDARAAMEAAPEVACLMAAELGKDAGWEAAQVAAFGELAAGYVVS